MPVRPFVCQFLKISVTTELIWLYFLGNILTGPVVVLGYFLRGWDTPNPPKNQKFLNRFFLIEWILRICYLIVKICDPFAFFSVG